MEPAFASRARGFLVRELQKAIGATPDGIFGKETATRLNNDDGCARESDYMRLGLEWPDIFHRCLNLTSALEDTSFEDCNILDIDGAGLTYGCIGFTTQHGEVQQLLRSYIAADPTADLQIEPHRRAEFNRLVATGGTPDEWKRFAYGSDGYIRPDLQFALRRWGSTSTMRKLQVKAARAKWMLAERCASRVGFWSMRARGFLFDTWVQNGGLRRSEVASLCAHRRGTEQTRMFHALQLLVKRCRPQFRRDVEARKLLFINGEGIVHGIRFSLEKQAFSV